MSVFSAMFSGVSGLYNHSTAFSMILADSTNTWISENLNTDFTIAGNDMFQVGKISWHIDSSGEIALNGFALRAWPLDSQGRLPGDPGNVNTAANPLLQNLQTFDLQKIVDNIDLDALELVSNTDNLEVSGETTLVSNSVII